jgi:enterochelin esterase-like enzyme
MNFLLDIPLRQNAFVIVVYSLTSLAVLALFVTRPSRKWNWRGWAIAVSSAVITGIAIALVLIWWLIYNQDVFGIDPPLRTKIAFTAGLVMLSVVIVGLWSATRKRRIASIGVALLIVLAVSTDINKTFGQYPTFRSVMGISAYPSGTILTLPSIGNVERPPIAHWTAPPNMPTAGYIASIDIPGTISGFTPRKAVVYLPPAALTSNPPLLPVMLLLSGQPGMPDDMFNMGGAFQVANEYALKHGGLAPILVAPDQLGDWHTNPMCVDSPLGRSATYLTQDVPNWIKANLGVMTDPAHWGVAGFSQGGTCAIQLGAGFPQIFGTLIDISGELDTGSGNPARTIQTAFEGDANLYDSAQPLERISAGAPFADTYATFAVGKEDNTFKEGQQKLAAAAGAARMHTNYFEVDGSAHDWQTASAAIKSSLTATFERWALTKPDLLSY